jgi:hypothetical protein
MNELKVQSAKVTAQIIVRDKDGNVKYQGPLVMDVVKEEEKEKENGRNTSDPG